MMESAAQTTTSATTPAPFIKEMVRQLRAIDSYGTYDNWPDEKVLDQLILTAEKKSEIPVVGDPDEEVLARLKAFYNAVAVRIESETGLLTVPLLHLSHEGFGRALVSTGKLIVLDRTLRDVHRFGFPSLAKLQAQGDRLVTSALANVEKFPEVARA